MTFPVIAATNTSETTTTSTSHVVALPASIGAGNLLVIAIYFAGNTITATLPAGWAAELVESADSNGTLWSAYKFASGSEGASVTVTSSATSLGVHASARWTGMHASSAPEAGTVAIIGNLAAQEPTGVTPSWGAADTQYMPLFGWRNAARTVSTYPTNYTGNQTTVNHSAGGNQGALAFCTRDLNATSEDPGALTLSAASVGKCITFAIRPAAGDKIIAADTGAHTFAGTAVTLRKGKILTAAAGAHTFAGPAVTLRHAWKVVVTAGAHTFVGTSVALKHAWKVIAGSGAHTFAGTNITLHKGYTIAAGSGAHTFAGTVVAIKHGYKVTAGTGAHTFAGADITVKRAWKLAVGVGAHTFAGTDVTLLKAGQKVIAAESGAHAFAGTPVTLQHGWKLTAESGAHSFTGTSITLKHAWKIGVDAGSHTFQGSDVTLTITAAPAPSPALGHRYAYDPRRDHHKDHQTRQQESQAELRKKIERAWALAHGLPDPYAEVIPEQPEAIPTPADLSMLFEAMASAQAAIDQENIETFIAAQQQMAEDEAIAVLLLS